jgi:hypothetical protein
MTIKHEEKLPLWVKYLIRVFFALVAVLFFYFTANGTAESLLLPAALLFGGFFATPDRNYKTSIKE